MAARQRQTYGEEVANVLTHGAGMLFGMTAIIILMMAAIRSGNPWAIGSFAVYVVCMTLSYVTSTFYHASTRARQKRLLRRSGRCLAEFQEDEKERPSENSLLSGNGLGSHNCF